MCVGEWQKVSFIIIASFASGSRYEKTPLLRGMQKESKIPVVHKRKNGTGSNYSIADRSV